MDTSAKGTPADRHQTQGGRRRAVGILATAAFAAVAVVAAATTGSGSDEPPTTESASADGAHSTLDTRLLARKTDPGGTAKGGGGGEKETGGGGKGGGPKTKSTTTTTTSTSTTSSSTTTTTAPPNPGPTPTASCLTTASPILRVTGAQTSQYRNTSVGVGTGIDATGARWDAADNWPIHLAGGLDACWYGGTIDGHYPDSTSWDALHSTGAFNILMPGLTVEAVRIHNYGDGIRMEELGSNFRVRGAHLSFVRDDCIENDFVHPGVVEDSLIDGCYVAFSARPHSGISFPVDGSANVWTIRSNLVRLQPMPTVYKGPIPGHAGFFKWDQEGDRSPQLSLHDNIFRADQDSNHMTMGVPAGKLASCSNNVMVWLGEGPYPDPLPSCFTVTTDRQVWDDAVAAWKDSHPTG